MFSWNPPPVMWAAAWSNPSRAIDRTTGASIAQGSRSSSTSGRAEPVGGLGEVEPVEQALRTSE